MEKAKELLVKFGECGQRIGEGVQVLAKELEQARVGAEKSAEAVSQRANQIQERQQTSDRMHERFHMLTEMVRKVSAMIAQLKKAEERAFLMKQLPEFDSQLGVLVTEAQKLKDDVQEANMKGLVRNAD